MNPAVEHITYRKFHPRLPHFDYNALATDKLTQLYATWHSAVMHSRSIPVRPSTIFKIHDFRRRVDDFHRRRFLKAFAKGHRPSKQTKTWGFGCAKFYTTKIQPGAVINYARAFRDRYAKHRYWRQHIPSLP